MNLSMYGDIGEYAIGCFCQDLSGTIKNIAFTNVDIDIKFSDSNIACLASDNGRFGVVCDGMDDDASIVNCYISGNIVIESEFKSVSGIAGGRHSYYTSIENCVCLTNINCVDSERISSISDSSSISHCYNVGVLEGNADIYGISAYGNQEYNYYLDTSVLSSKSKDGRAKPLTTVMMKSQGSFVGFDFENVWEIDPYCSYPYPQLKNNRIVRLDSLTLVAPTKKVYFQGDKLDLTNASVTLSYEDDINSTIPLDESMLSGYDMNTIGHQTVIVSYGGKSQSFDIEVQEIPVDGISIKDAISVYRPESIQITATILPQNASDKTITWTSSDDSIATVSQDGTVRAKNPGTVTITAQSNNGKKATCEVTVLAACVSMKMNKEKCKINVGDIGELKVSKVPLNSSDEVKWKTSNRKIVDVEDGEIYAISEGKATITAYTDRGVTATCVVTVTDTAKTIKQAKATKAKIKSIKNASGKKIKLSLSGKSKCDGYEIQYALKKSFSGKKVLKKTGGSVTVSNLKKSKNYFVRVRAYKKIEGTMYYGAWSKAKKIKIKK